MSDFWYWNKSRITSLIIAGNYLIIGLIFWQDARLITLVFFIFFALVYIWFGDELGGFEGVSNKGYIRKTPGVFMKFGGWVLLSLPVILVIKAAKQ